MSFKLAKDKIHRKKKKLLEIEVLSLKTLLLCPLPRRLSINLRTRLLALHQNTRFSLLNICLSSLRSKSVFKKFGISRIKFRELGRYGVVSGLKKK